MIIVGIDVAKDKHDCFIMYSKGEAPFYVFTIANTIEWYNALLIISSPFPVNWIK